VNILRRGESKYAPRTDAAAEVCCRLDADTQYCCVDTVHKALTTAGRLGLLAFQSHIDKSPETHPMVVSIKCNSPGEVPPIIS